MNPSSSVLLTDLYQLTMLQAYFDAGMEDEAVFEFFVRKLPPGYGYLVAAGLEQVLQTLEQVRFLDEDLAWMERSGRFSREFINHLRDFRFTGEVYAMAEGSLFFANEPVLRVHAPLPQAQLLETRIINLLQYQILVAAKAARCITVAPGKQLVDFGLRRAHGAEAGLLAARASYIGGFEGTSTVLAAPHFDIPVFGTMAHSFVESHDSELQSFADFARAQPDNVVLLIDTYDTEAAARKLARVAKRLASQGVNIKAVRLDSGDLAKHAFQVRRILDEGGLEQVKIFASGGVDEYKLKHILDTGAPVDGFGIGSKLDTSANAPYLDCAYKLMQYAGVPRRKYSETKATWPGPKQVLRRYGDDGLMREDEIVLAGEDAEGEPLLSQVMAGGWRLGDSPSLDHAREHLQEQLRRLPDELKRLDAEPDYPVRISAGIHELAEETDRFIAKQAEEEGESFPV